MKAAPFLIKTYEMVDDPSTDPMVSWFHSRSFVVWDVPLFSRDLLPKFFKHSNFSSFLRQLNTYGFRKVDPDRWEFANEGFLKDQKHLLKGIGRRKPVHANNYHHHHTIVQNSSHKASCDEVAKVGLVEEVARLKENKNVLVQQLVRSKQKQQATDKRLLTVGQRVQLMEQKQQQMMSYLAKAVQSPGFFAKLVQQQTDVNMHIPVIGKKRRLPNHDEDHMGMECVHSDGQIVRYQPLMNEPVRFMLQHILKPDVPLLGLSQPLKETSMFLTDDMPSASHAVDQGSCSTQTSGATSSSSISPTLKQPSFPAETGFSTKSALIPGTKIHSSLTRSYSGEQGQILETTMHTSQHDTESSWHNQLQEICDNTVEFPEVHFTGTRNADVSLMDMLSTVQNGITLLDMDKYSPGVKLDVLSPKSNDAFWEQYFQVDPLPKVTEEVVSCIMEDGEDKEHEVGQDEGWEKLHHMNQLAEQMDLLIAETKRA